MSANTSLIAVAFVTTAVYLLTRDTVPTWLGCVYACLIVSCCTPAIHGDYHRRLKPFLRIGASHGKLSIF